MNPSAKCTFLQKIKNFGPKGIKVSTDGRGKYAHFLGADDQSSFPPNHSDKTRKLTCFEKYIHLHVTQTESRDYLESIETR
jgi:hypothetical protein